MLHRENGEFLSRIKTWQGIVAVCWLLMHVLALPLALKLLFPRMSTADLNLWVYVIGVLVLGLLCLSFLARDFKTFRKDIGPILLLALLGYLAMLKTNAVVSLPLALLGERENPNNAAIMELVSEEKVKLLLVSVLLAPLLEELMFRAGVFGLIRRRSRALAYIVSVLLFAVYHVWAYALEDPIYLLYFLQYLPAGAMLCLIYEKTGTIWGSFVVHLINNTVSMIALSFLGSMNL